MILNLVHIGSFSSNLKIMVPLLFAINPSNLKEISL